MDKLDKLFSMQWELNQKVFNKQGIKANMGDLYLAGCKNDHGANSETNLWLKKYLEALKDESRELEEELLWKFWSKDKLDMQNIRVEIVDQLHFWISLSLMAGMSSDKVFDMYCQKNKVNNERQENGYCKENKDENDNKGIE